MAAAALAAVYPNLWLNDGLIMSESVAALAVSLWVLAGCAWYDRRSPGRAFVFGAAAGAAALARSELVVLAAVSVAVILVVEWRAGRLRGASAAAAGAALVLAPWIVPNLVRFEEPVVLSTNEGTTLRGANCDETYAGPALGSWAMPCIAQPKIVALEPSLRSDRWRSDGLRYAREHAGRVPAVVTARVGRALDLYGLDYQIDESCATAGPARAPGPASRRSGSWPPWPQWGSPAPVAWRGGCCSRRPSRSRSARSPSTAVTASGRRSSPSSSSPAALAAGPVARRLLERRRDEREVVPHPHVKDAVAP